MPPSEGTGMGAGSASGGATVGTSAPWSVVQGAPIFGSPPSSVKDTGGHGRAAPLPAVGGARLLQRHAAIRDRDPPLPSANPDTHAIPWHVLDAGVEDRLGVLTSSRSGGHLSELTDPAQHVRRWSRSPSATA